MSEIKQNEIEQPDEALQPGQTCYWIEDLYGCRIPNVQTGTVIRYGHRVQIRMPSGLIVDKEHTFVRGTLDELRVAVHEHTKRINQMAERAIIRARKRIQWETER